MHAFFQCSRRRRHRHCCGPAGPAADDRGHDSRVGKRRLLCVGNKAHQRRALVDVWLRKQYYRLAERLSSIETIQNFTGFGLYDRKVVELVRSFDDPYPYFRGMIADIGLPTVKLLYDQPARKFGITKNNWYNPLRHRHARHYQPFEGSPSPATFAGFSGPASRSSLP